MSARLGRTGRRAWAVTVHPLWPRPVPLPGFREKEDVGVGVGDRQMLRGIVRDHDLVPNLCDAGTCTERVRVRPPERLPPRSFTGSGLGKGPALLGCLALVGIAAVGCEDEGADGVSFRVTDLRMTRCAGVHAGSVLRLVARNDGGSTVEVLRVEVGAHPRADIGNVRGTLAVTPGLSLAPGTETPIVCWGGLPAAFAPFWNPPTVPVNVALVYGAVGDERRLFEPAEIVIEYNAQPCHHIPTEPCRVEE